MEDSVPFLEMISEPIPLLAQDTRLGAWASSLGGGLDTQSIYCLHHTQEVKRHHVTY